MTRGEFTSRGIVSERFYKRIPWWFFMCMTVSGVFGIIYLLIGVCILGFTDYFFEALTPILLAVFSCLTLFCALPFVHWVWKRKMTKLGLKCPSCHKFFWNVSFKTTAESGQCHYCGEKIFD